MIPLCYERTAQTALPTTAVNGYELDALDLPADTEVGQHVTDFAPLLRDQNVAGLDIAVNYPLCVRAGKGLGHVDEEVLKLYTHVHNDASQAAMQRLAEANTRLQEPEKPRKEAAGDSAQSQHSDKEERDERDAK